MSTSTLVRRRSLLLSAAASAALAACGGGDDDGAADAPAAWRVPAETEPQQAVMLASIGYDYKVGWSILETQAAMIAALAPSVPVVYLVNSAEEREAMRLALGAAQMSGTQIAQRVRFLTVEHAEMWVRDYGGIFQTTARGDLRMVDFDFDGYGYNAFSGPDTNDTYNTDNDLAVRVGAAMGVECVRSPLVCEGGNLHFNGRGTVIALLGDGTEGVGLLGRNKGWTAAQIEAELKRVFSVTKVIFLKRNMPSDAHTVMQTPYRMPDDVWAYNVGVTHIDEMIAWVDERTLLLPEVTGAELAAAIAAGDPVTQLAHDVLQEAHAILSAATDQDGRPFTIVRVPEPGPIVVELTPDDNAWWMIADMNQHPTHKLKGAERFANEEPVSYLLPASYMNFVVSDGVVLVPRFYQPGRDLTLKDKDAAFAQIIAARYPGRRVVQIAPDALLAGGGGLHCITQQIPKQVAWQFAV
ncbi:MAG: agmatine deiminase family protein [Ottowia sp.]|uniref:agmatine deiminase family protein n=1 Tax=Ottowia sp. TaxID=1898956 RepID=UPI0039E6C783